MNIKDLKAAASVAGKYGVKAVVYGQPGCGKTPLTETCPSPVMCATEPGMLTLRNAHNLPCFEAYDAKSITEFFDWVFGSAETKSFDTIAVDSVSQLAEIILSDELARNKDGRKAYGEMSRKVMGILRGLYYLKDKHLYLICKQGTFDDENGLVKKPYFPGQELNVQVPHLMDEVLYLGMTNIPGVVGQQLAVRTKSTFNIWARDRSMRLAELEPPNFGNIFNKCLS